MQLRYKSRISGEFNGWDGDAIFELDNGTKWQQSRYKYTYRYRYRPQAKVWQQGGRYFLEVEGMNEMIEVHRLA